MPKQSKSKSNNNGKTLATQQSVDQAVKSICDIMRRGNCAGALQDFLNDAILAETAAFSGTEAEMGDFHRRIGLFTVSSSRRHDPTASSDTARRPMPDRDS
jgi:hypothetical protein